MPTLTALVSADEEAHCRGLQPLIRFVRVGSDLFPVLSDLKPGKKEEISFHTADVREDLVADFRELLTRLVFHRSAQFVSSGPARRILSPMMGGFLPPFLSEIIPPGKDF